ncbi:MAG: FG-GAP repeat domain-containing protein [Chloroflexota bacterium]
MNAEIMEQPRRRKKKKTLQNILILLFIFLIIAGIPYAFLKYQSRQSGLSMKEVIQRKINRNGNAENMGSVAGITGEKIDFLTPSPAGQGYTEPPQISHVLAGDLDKDGLNDIIVCDSRDNFVSWIRQNPAGTYTEKVLASGLIAPAHAQITDFDRDGDNDVLVGVLGMLFPNNDKIGSVVLLENNDLTFTPRVIIEKIARVSDARAGDLDNDGDNDIAVAQFGYDDGETRWLENKGNWQFESHILQNLSGPINAEIEDFDQDGDQDIISIASQEWEEIWCFANEGKGTFKPQLVWGSSNEDFGSSGISACDIDLDGDMDILYTNGDAFDYIPPAPRPWHGVSWLENTGGLKFEYHRICDFNGAFSARSCDADGDGDNDVFVVSGFNTWDKPEAQSFIWLENNGEMQFIKHDITNAPTHLLTLDIADFNNDGKPDFVTGGMHPYPPYDRMGRITLWLNNGILPSR